ncbi:protein FAR1-RELATED SEQUENCE 5-like [Bidens hawaiensis]|uniref:protein FAR1-RELATED SEQUENCE 5-like n=1 Tax=Bidens hawaiensis TaxID=980011 RepID=UPI00404B667E
MVDANDMHFVRSNRKLTHVQQDIMYEMSTLNLGPVKAFNILGTKYGGFEEVGATKDYCKNFKQSLTCFIGEYDVEMVVQRLSWKKNCCDDYSFEYTVNNNGGLDHLFWTDEIPKKNYLAFEILYHLMLHLRPTSMYKMVFVPFTAIDNHCRNVTVGGGLLSSESIESYSCLLKVFLDSFCIASKVVVTDQDPSMKQTISLVFPDSRHRLCMWHIMKKLADMLSLVELFSHFDHCMEIQRHNGRKNDHHTRYMHPALVSENPFEKEVELMYTRAIFNDFQDVQYHIRSGVACLKSTEEEDLMRFYAFDFNAYVPGCLEVLFKKDGKDGIDSTISCGCKIFEHYGLLCRHSLYILHLFRVTRFPKKYMLDRWKGDAGVNPRTAPISSFCNEKNFKDKEISRKITLAGEYLM